MISLDKCNGSCKILSPKICVWKETEDINVKAFNMITNKMKIKQWQNIFNVIINANLIVQLAIQIKNGITKLVNVNVNVNVSWNPSTGICENSKYLRSIANTSVIQCDEIITILNIISTKKANNIVANVTSNVSVNCHSIKVRDFYILHTVLLVIILLLIIIIVCYHYAKQKDINVQTM